MASDVLSGEEIAVLERLRDLSDHSVNLDRHQLLQTNRTNRSGRGRCSCWVPGDLHVDAGAPLAEFTIVSDPFPPATMLHQLPGFEERLAGYQGGANAVAVCLVDYLGKV